MSTQLPQTPSRQPRGYRKLNNTRRTRTIIWYSLEGFETCLLVLQIGIGRRLENGLAYCKLYDFED
jgi:hypothetical protein